MTLAAAAVCPSAPALLPALVAGAAPELDAVRAACADAVAALVDARCDAWYVVGADTGPRARSMAPWGVDIPVDVPEPLPLPLLVGAWLTAGHVRSFVAVDPELDAAECAELGAELAGSADRVALLVVGDGSARHHEKAPGYRDHRAGPFDAAATRALAEADAAALLRLDPRLAAELLAAGRAPWQVLAGAALAGAAPAGAEPGEAQDGGARHTGTLRYADAPYGVGYLVASWQLAEGRGAR